VPRAADLIVADFWAPAIYSWPMPNDRDQFFGRDLTPVLVSVAIGRSTHRLRPWRGGAAAEPSTSKLLEVLRTLVEYSAAR